MTYCTRCGKPLNSSDRFCSGCGKEVDKTSCQGAGIREERWEGAVYKCPRCGEKIDAYMRCCPACGFEFRDIGAVSSVKELATKIELAESDDSRAVLVRSFPIPNSREDIVEFLIMAVTNIDESAPYGASEEENLAKAWIAKADQALQKADLVIPSDEVYLRSKESYKKKVKAFSKAQKKRGKRGQKRRQLSDEKATLLFVAFLIILLFAMALIGI